MPAMYPETVQLFYDESKAARQGLDEVIRQYRTNTTAVVAFATGAATFFGLEFPLATPRDESGAPGGCCASFVA
jgi:hypothetical protein